MLHTVETPVRVPSGGKGGIPLHVTSAMPCDYGLFRGIEHNMFDVFQNGLGGEEIIQVVHDGNLWYGWEAWATAGDARQDRDHYLGWHACQRAERLKLVARNLKSMPRPPRPGEPDWPALALRAATSTLPEVWEEFFGYRPLLAESILDAGNPAASRLKADGWANCSGRNPRHHMTHWAKELAPEARMMLRRRQLPGPDATGGISPLFGLLPIPDHLLGSLKEALDALHDPRSRQSYPIGSVMAIRFMAMLCGCGNLRQVAEFGKRLTHQQATLLGLPHRNKQGMAMEPGYYTYYDLVPKTDAVEAVNILDAWLAENQAGLPSVLWPGVPLVVDVFRSMVMAGYAAAQARDKKLRASLYVPPAPDPSVPPESGPSVPPAGRTPRNMMDEIRRDTFLH